MLENLKGKQKNLRQLIGYQDQEAAATHGSRATKAGAGVLRSQGMELHEN